MNSHKLVDTVLARFAILNHQRASERVSHNTSRATHTTGSDSERAQESSQNHTEDTTERSLADLEAENQVLRTALQDIYLASRDAGLAAMCNWMRGRAAAALSEVHKS